jgi:hypothetical protein
MHAPALQRQSSYAVSSKEKSKTQENRSLRGPVITAADAAKIYSAKSRKTRHEAARLAAKFGITAKAIRDIWRRRTWKRTTEHLWARQETQNDMENCNTRLADEASRAAADEFGELATQKGMQLGEKSFPPAPIFTNVKFSDGWMVDPRVIAYFMSN